MLPIVRTVLSLLWTWNNRTVADYIKIGNNPSAIAADSSTNTTYVANRDNGTVSVIDGKVNKVVAKVMFNIEPFNAGHIECDKDKKTSNCISILYRVWFCMYS